MKDESVYYLVRFAAYDAREDYQKILTYISGFEETSVTHNTETEVVISHKNEPHLLMDLGEFGVNAAVNKKAAIVCRMSPGDGLSISLLKHLIEKFEYRLYSVHLGSFVPLSDDFRDVSQIVLNEKTVEVFAKKHVTPLFQYGFTYQYYGYIGESKAVHIINPGIMQYYEAFGVQEGEQVGEFSYEVAPSLEQFVAFADRNAIPTNFYEYYGKSQRIINRSGVDIWHVDRKIFVKPYSCTYHPETQSYELYTADKAALNNASKILPGENLDRALVRMLKEWIKLSDNYIRAVVNRDVQFDRDKANRLTPLLTVSLLLPEVTTKQVPQTAQRSWVSLKDVVN